MDRGRCSPPDSDSTPPYILLTLGVILFFAAALWTYAGKARIRFHGWVYGAEEPIRLKQHPAYARPRRAGRHTQVLDAVVSMLKSGRPRAGTRKFLMRSFGWQSAVNYSRQVTFSGRGSRRF